MPKTCYYGLKSRRRICKYALITSLLAYIFVKRNVRKKGHGHCIFFQNHNYHREFVYKALILDNKQLLSNLIDHKAT